MNYNFALCNFLSEDPVKDVFVVSYFISIGCKIVSPSVADFLICDVNPHQTVDVSKYPKIPKLLVMGENAYVWYGNGNTRDLNVLNNISHQISKYNYAFITNNDINLLNTKVFYMPFAMQAYDLETVIENRKSPLLLKKEKFCCFCVKNASSSWKGCVYRDQFFHKLSEYKKVDSLGPHLNNVGGPIPREGFEEYISSYKFMICFENSSAPGYITEKIMRCFVSQIIPVYWGHKSIVNYVNPKSFIFVDMEDPQGMEKAIERIKYLNEHKDEYMEMLYEDPILNYEPFDRKRIYKECNQFLIDYQETMEKNRLPAPVPIQLPGTEHVRFVLQINNCRKYASRREMQTKTWCQDLPEYIVWYHVVGDPTLTSCVYKPEEHLLIVPAGDSYECLPQKVYQSYTFAYMNFPSATHLVKTDDDAIVNVDKLISILEQNKNKHYYGGLVSHGGGKNFYGYDIVQDKSKLPVDGIDTPKIKYIVGGVICISMPALNLLSKRKEIFDKFIYEDLFVAEAIADSYPPEHLKLFSNEFDFDVPVFIVDRVNVSVPKFFERYEHYYQLFCKPQKFLLVFDNNEEERINKMRILFPNCNKFDYSFVPDYQKENITGIAVIKPNLLINFIELEKFLIHYSCKYDIYDTEFFTYTSKYNVIKRTLSNECSHIFTNVNENNIYDFAHEGIFSTATGMPGLEICNKLFSYTPFYSSYYQSKIYSEMKDFRIASNMACRCINNIENNKQSHFIYNYIIHLCAIFGSHEMLIYFYRDAISKGVSSLKMHYEHYMAGFQVHKPNKKEIMESAMQVLDSRVGVSYRNITWSNVHRFVVQLPSSITKLNNMPTIPKEFTYSSISIANNKENNGYIGILRTHSYRVEGTNYISNCEDGIIRTVNYYLVIDNQLNVTSSTEIKILDNKPFKSSVIGLEDCRYFRLNDKEYILGVSYEHVDNTRKRTVAMVYYEMDSNKECRVPVIMKTPQDCEKNWLPITEDCETQPKFIYSISPTKIVELSGKKQGIRTLYEQKEHFDDERGSCKIPFTWKNIDGYLVLTHRVIHLATRIYLNRFFFMDKTFKIIAKSNYFYFLHIGIEYCLGCAYGTENDILFGVSKSDKETFIVKVPIFDICTQLCQTDSSVAK